MFQKPEGVIAWARQEWSRGELLRALGNAGVRSKQSAQGRPKRTIQSFPSLRA